MSNDQPSPDCHECGGSGTNAFSLPCSVCHRKANLDARRHPVSDSVVLVNVPFKADPEVWRQVKTDTPGSKYAALAACMADGLPLETSILATTGQPSPYSAAAVEATVDHPRQRIRELEADLSTVRWERDDVRDAARAVVDLCERDDDEEGLQQCDCGVRDRVTGSARWRRLVALVKP